MKKSKKGNLQIKAISKKGNALLTESKRMSLFKAMQRQQCCASQPQQEKSRSGILYLLNCVSCILFLCILYFVFVYLVFCLCVCVFCVCVICILSLCVMHIELLCKSSPTKQRSHAVSKCTRTSCTSCTRTSCTGISECTSAIYMDNQHRSAN